MLKIQRLKKHEALRRCNRSSSNEQVHKRSPTTTSKLGHIRSRAHYSADCDSHRRVLQAHTLLPRHRSKRGTLEPLRTRKHRVNFLTENAKKNVSSASLCLSRGEVKFLRPELERMLNVPRRNRIVTDPPSLPLPKNMK